MALTLTAAERPHVRVTQALFEENFRTSLASRGVVLDGSDSHTEPLPRTLPVALRAWYRVAGGSDLNSAHNRILGPDDLRYHGGQVTFVEENQDAVVWAFTPFNKNGDPEVWQGQTSVEGEGRILAQITLVPEGTAWYQRYR